MKIGVLTYHRSHNYGALLQAVATRVTLQKMGHDAYYIDYFPAYHKREYQLFSWYHFFRMGIKAKAEYVISRIKEYPYRKERYNNFAEFIKNEIEPYCKPVSEKYDAIIYGSDQIWRIQKALGDFNPVYFGVNGFHASKHISYAASMGDVSLTEQKKKELADLLNHLDSISVREESLKIVLESLGYTNVRVVLDPVLLLNTEDWLKVSRRDFTPTKKYILLYDLLKGSFDINAVRSFAKEKDLDIIEIIGSARRKSSYSCRSTAGPYQFLNLISNAEYVFTSSFHGLVFSLLFNKQFFASYKKNSGRAFSILSFLGLENRLIKVGLQVIPHFLDIDYKEVNTRINELRKKSMEFLDSNC